MRDAHKFHNFRRARDAAACEILKEIFTEFSNPLYEESQKVSFFS